ncbi:nitrogen regulation protein NR(I) [Desulfocucumis palustris]|uniref:Nitrogen regulation protein NR(I) n=1 Tax=Desulfocucumis palustris TaxID=1898651 RepID=A0A2L2XF93_9FIRM|nr:nitrogen regulation protein NR(I) [Desulfocucumis palustris]
MLKLLRDNMVPEPVSKPEMIGLCSPADKGDFLITLYPYNIEESGESRNNDMRSVGTGQLQYPPLTVYIDYLCTTHSIADLKSRMLDESRILGRLMQVFYDNAIIKSALLQGSLAEKNEQLRITLKKINVDEMNKIWNFPNVPYKLSVGYRVGPVNIDSTRTRATRRVMGVES